MKNLDNQLKNMKIPSIKDEIFEKKLSNDIKRDIILKPKNYKLRFEVVSIAATFLIILNIVFFVKPDLLNKVTPSSTEIVANQDEQELKNLNIEKEDFISAEKISYEDIDGSELMKHLDKKEIKKDKTYIVRKYKSKGNGVMTVVSEFDKNKQKEKIMKLVDSSM